jgi:hypothetical protein
VPIRWHEPKPLWRFVLACTCCSGYKEPVVKRKFKGLKPTAGAITGLSAGLLLAWRFDLLPLPIPESAGAAGQIVLAMVISVAVSSAVYFVLKSSLNVWQASRPRNGRGDKHDDRRPDAS